MTLADHTTIQFPYYDDDVVVFLFNDGSKARIFSLSFNAEFPSFKALVQECDDYNDFFRKREQT